MLYVEIFFMDVKENYTKPIMMAWKNSLMH